MSLDSILDAITRATEARFEKNDTRYARAAAHAEPLMQYADALTPEHLSRLDNLVVSLKYRARNNSHESLDTVIARLDEIRTPYRTQRPYIGLAIAEAKGVRYEKRFQELKTYLQEERWCYDDIALTKHALEKNSYLRRRAKQDATFAAQYTEMLDELTEALALYDAHAPKPSLQEPRNASSPYERSPPPPPTRFSRLRRTAKTIIQQAAVVASGAMLFAAALPTSVYLPLLT